MKSIAVKPMLLASFAVALLSVLPAHADEWSKTYTVSGSPDLRIETTDANIRVTTWDQNTVEAKVKEATLRVLENAQRRIA